MKHAWWLSSLMMAGLATAEGLREDVPVLRGTRFVSFEDFGDWEKRTGAGGVEVWESPEVDPDLAWDELVLSWNGDTPGGSGLVFEAAPGWPGEPVTYYNLGRWSTDPARFPRESVRGQADARAEVRTDILVLRQPTRRVRLRVGHVPGPAGERPALRLVGASFLNRGYRAPTRVSDGRAWGRILEVPQRSQVEYPEGVTEWCSPTCVAMVLGWWAERAGRPGWAVPVPEVARAVHDPAWGGTGNWSFNTAFAGSLSGLRAVVVRLDDLVEVEDWILAGIPVVASVDYDRLRGLETSRGSGHLVVVVGFTGEGDVVVNDPGTRHRIRNTFPRAAFARAWEHSRRTVYWIHPTAVPMPADRFGIFGCVRSPDR